VRRETLAESNAVRLAPHWTAWALLDAAGATCFNAVKPLKEVLNKTSCIDLPHLNDAPF